MVALALILSFPKDKSVDDLGDCAFVASRARDIIAGLADYSSILEVMDMEQQIQKKRIFSGTEAPVAITFSHWVLKIYSEGESQQTRRSGYASQSLKPIKDLPVPVG